MSTDTTIRVRLTTDTVDALNEATAHFARDADTVIQLALQAVRSIDPAALTDSAAQELSAPGLSYQDMRTDLAAIAPDLRIAAMRLGPLAPAKNHPVFDGFGFRRNQIGADLDTGQRQLWDSSAEYWVIGDHSNAIVPVRLGKPLALFSGVTWSETNDDGRRYATSGYRIDNVGDEIVRLDPRTDAQLGSATTQEADALNYLLGVRLLMPNGASNPVVNLFTR